MFAKHFIDTNAGKELNEEAEAAKNQKTFYPNAALRITRYWDKERQDHTAGPSGQQPSSCLPEFPPRTNHKKDKINFPQNWLAAPLEDRKSQQFPHNPD